MSIHDIVKGKTLRFFKLNALRINHSRGSESLKIKYHFKKTQESSSVQSIVSAMLAGAKDMENAFAYEGINPFTMRQVLAELGGPHLKQDLPSLLMLYLQRGTSLCNYF
ncbi:hypothetical protein WA026_004510 [Henosepilachna vigintioctopunctata]|uniref:Uncharacterized protein n=1 Tax=Henosepilachna vigintioctopunctata TaxID=420089 RepID=A0AAW1VB13_9CUCU